MKLSPLQLQHYHFNHFALSSREGIDIKTHADSFYPPIHPDDVDTKVELLTPADEDPHEFVVNLSVDSIISDANKHFPYKFSVQAEGFFHMDHDGSLEERKRLVVCNGASILYGAIREQLLMLTTRHRYGPIMLPTASFLGFGPTSSTIEKRKSKTKPPKISKKIAK